ncbi:hypothetical protein D4R86_00455 [bacterium]|nr:MAG: hypothetical protein D4R86_00455 [bacterium]
MKTKIMRIKRTTGQVLICTCLFILLSTVSNAAADTFIVGPGPGEYNTIQDAVDDANQYDIIQVKAGIYRETVTINKSNITLQAFPGDEHKAIITGAVSITGWVNATGPGQVQGNPNWQDIWIADTSGEVQQLFRNNDERLARSRYPDTEGQYRRPTSVQSNSVFSDSGLHGGNDYWKDGIAHTKGTPWRIDPHKITGFNSGSKTITLNEAHNEGLSTKYGYFITNAVGEINSNGEWAYKNNKLYLMSTSGTPVGIEADKNRYGIKIGEDVSSVTVSGLVVERVKKSCIQVGNEYDYNGRANNIIIENNVLRDGFYFGILITVGRNHKIRNNDISYCEALGIRTHCIDYDIEGNYLHCIGADSLGGDILSRDGNQSAISINPRGGYTEHSFRVYNNRIDNVGGCGIALIAGSQGQRARKGFISYNHITNTMLSLNDGGAIYIQVFPEATGDEWTIIDHNIIEDSWGYWEGTPKHGRSRESHASEAEGIYIDNSAERPFMPDDLKVEKNTVISAWDSGVFTKSDNCVFHDNTYFNCYKNQWFEAWGPSNNECRREIYYALPGNTHTTNHDMGNAVLNSDNNYYHFGTGSSFAFILHNTTFYDLAGWRSEKGQDYNSVELPTSAGGMSTSSYAKIMVNNTLETSTVNLSGRYDMRGNALGAVAIAPHESFIFIGDYDGAVNRVVYLGDTDPGPRPTAIIDVNIDSGKAPLAVSFNGSDSISPNTIVTYEWDLDNDGNFETSGMVVSHEYNHDMASDVTYAVGLKVTDDQGLNDTATIDILVTPRDIDSDNLPDVWELEYFTDLSQGADDDPDQDGFTNLVEFNSGTDPNIFNEAPQDLILWMEFDNNAQDSSGNNNHGILQADADTVFDSERNSNVLVLDGSEDYVQVPDNSSLDITGPITVSLWVKVNSDGWLGMLSKGDSGAKQNNYQLYARGLTGVRWQTWAAGHAANIAEFGTLAAGQWYLLTGIYDGANVISYLNDQQVESNPTTNPSQVVPQPLDIGRWAGNYLNGRIDDVRIYNRALNADEIKGLYEGNHIPVIESIARVIPPGSQLDADLIISGYNFDSYSGDAGYNPDADTDKDGDNDYDDYMAIMDAFDSSAGDVNYNPDADIDCDGIVKYEDYKVILQTFGSKRGANYVRFQNGISAEVISWSDTEIRCKIPKKAVSGELVVVTSSGVSNAVFSNITDVISQAQQPSFIQETTPPSIQETPEVLQEIISDAAPDIQAVEPEAPQDTLQAAQDAGFVPIGKGLTNAYYIDDDGDGYGVGNRAPNGADADDNDPQVNTPESVIAKYGTLENFLRTVKGYNPNRIFYISLDGDNATAEANNINKPYRSLSATLKGLLAGDDIVIYRGGSYVSNYGIGTSSPIVQGQEGRPIVFMAYPGEKVIFYAAENGIDTYTTSYLIFDGFVLDNDNPSRYGNGVKTYDIEHLIFRNIESLNHSRGFQATHLQDLLIENCVMHDNPGSHGFYLNAHQRTSSNVTVRGCISYHNGRHGIQQNGRITNLLIEDCILHSNVLGGISLIMGVCDSVVRNNLIFNNDKQGIVFYLYDSGVDWVPTNDQNNNIIENNLIWIGRYEWQDNGRTEPGNTSAIHFNDSTAGQSHSMSGNIIRNNIVMTYCGPSFSFYQSRFAESTIIENNLIYRLGNQYSQGPDRILAVGVDFANCYGFAEFEAYSSLFRNNTFGDPKLTDVSIDYFRKPGTFNFDYLSGSPAINYPGMLEAAAFDLKGNVRDSSPDAGCYEYGGVPAPLTITTSSLTNVKEGDFYEVSLSAVGGVMPYVWSIISGVLPDNLSLNSSGVISGAPSSVGMYNFTVRVTDMSGLTQEATKSLALLVTERPINHPPVLGLVGEKSVMVGDLLEFIVSGTDPDGDAVNYSAENLPQGAIFQEGGIPDNRGLTLEAWFKADDFDVNDGRIISKATGMQEQEHYWMLSTIKSGDYIRLRFRLKTDGVTTTLIANSGNIQPGQWVHAVAVYDEGSMRLYQDGSEIGYVGKNGTVSVNETVPVYIGSNPTDPKPFDGIIDEARIWNRPLSQEEITSIYQGATASPMGLVAYWSLDNGLPEATDSSGNGHRGTINGAVYSAGRINLGLEFDGVNDYVDAGTFDILPNTDNPDLPTFNWRPADGQSGDYVVTFKVSDGELEDSEEVTISVSTVIDTPIIENITPASGQPGDEFIIAGRGLGSYSGDAGYNPDADTDIDGDIDYYDYLMVLNNFKADNPDPAADINCDGKVEYEDYKIILKTFGSKRGANYVRFQNGVSAEFISWSDTEIKCKIPKKAVSGDIVVVTEQGESNSVLFEIIGK